MVLKVEYIGTDNGSREMDACFAKQASEDSKQLWHFSFVPPFLCLE